MASGLKQLRDPGVPLLHVTLYEWLRGKEKGKKKKKSNYPANPKLHSFPKEDF